MIWLEAIGCAMILGGHVWLFVQSRKYGAACYRRGYYDAQAHRPMDPRGKE
jgi:hypothetical protein